jgi:UDPglucose 6-dehydrogenase
VKKISVVGSGYVGLTTAVGLAGNGNEVICVDTDEVKVRQINRGEPPFYETGFQNKLAHLVNDEGSLKATSDFKEIIGSDITFICVGTPCNSVGSIDLNCIKRSVQEIGNVLNQGENHQTVVVRSTVIPGTTEDVILPALEKSSKMKAGRDFSIAMNPEFLQEGRALRDFANPDRIVIGEFDHRSGDTLNEIYKDFHAPIIRTNIRTAEMIKYASNAFLATKISFINEIGNICKRLGIDVYDVAQTIGQDPRIGGQFLNAGIGFGGSCLPKDVSALINKGNELGYEANLLRSILNLNREQPTRLIDIVKKRLGKIEDRVITVLGLAFKPNTDDVRLAPSLQIIDLLHVEKARIKVYDPMVKPGIKLPGYEFVEFCDTLPYSILDADCIILATEWDEFKDEHLYAGKFVIDGRRVLNPQKARQICRYYEGICW